MAHYNTILHQLLTLLPRHQFDRIVEALDGDRYVKSFSTWNQTTTLLYAQASGKGSLREIENGLLAQGSRLYHLGLPAKVARSTLADANSRRDYRIYEKLFYELLARCRSLTPQHRFRFSHPLYSIDATVLELCLSMFPWAKFRKRKGALKLHYQFDHAGELPAFLTITDGKRHEVSVAKETFPLSPDSIYCMDRAYIDWVWLRRIHDGGAFFVTRAKQNLAGRLAGQLETSKNKRVIFDAIIGTDTAQARRDFPYPLRLIGYFDPESGRYFEFLTNIFHLAASTIAAIYKARWQIEIFFKWIKGNLKIKTFLGTSKNAVLTQVWVAMCYYLLLAYIKFQTKCRFSLFYLHRLVRETLLDRLSLLDLLNLNEPRLARLRCEDPQLCLQL